MPCHAMPDDNGQAQRTPGCVTTSTRLSPRLHRLFETLTSLSWRASCGQQGRWVCAGVLLTEEIEGGFATHGANFAEGHGAELEDRPRIACPELWFLFVFFCLSVMFLVPDGDFFCSLSVKDMVGVLQRKTVNMLKLAGEMGKLERQPVVDADVKARLRYARASSARTRYPFFGLFFLFFCFFVVVFVGCVFFLQMVRDCGTSKGFAHQLGYSSVLRRAAGKLIFLHPPPIFSVWFFCLVWICCCWCVSILQ